MFRVEYQCVVPCSSFMAFLLLLPRHVDHDSSLALAACLHACALAALYSGQGSTPVHVYCEMDQFWTLFVADQGRREHTSHCCVFYAFALLPTYAFSPASSFLVRDLLASCILPHHRLF